MFLAIKNKILCVTSSLETELSRFVRAHAWVSTTVGLRFGLAFDNGISTEEEEYLRWKKNVVTVLDGSDGRKKLFL